MPTTRLTDIHKICNYLEPVYQHLMNVDQQDQGSQVAPQGCKISPCNSTISIEPNVAPFDEITLVESIKYNLKWPKKDPDMAPI